MAAARAVLCGLVRDAEADLARVAPQVEALAAGFADHRIFLFENDSEDGTVAALERWARRDPRVSFASERLGRPRHPSTRSEARRADMADYRARCQRAVLERFGDFDYVVLLDTDLVGYDAVGLAQALGWDGWDVLAAKGVSHLRGRFLCPDAWAYRDERDPDGTAPALRVHAIVPPRGAPLRPVLSCFGGLALYRMEAYRAGRYGSHDCEHVTFHESLRERGFDRIFMDPSLLTLYPDFASLYPGNALRHLSRWDEERRAAADEPTARDGRPHPARRAEAPGAVARDSGSVATKGRRV